MENSLRPFFLLLLLVTSCGPKVSSIDYGKTTVADLISQKGEPLSKESIPVKEGEVFHYSDGEKYQVQGDTVTASFKSPQGDQRTLIYWKHKFKDCETVLRKMGEPKGDQLIEYEMSCDPLGKRVIYSDGSEFISRLVEYEKK